MELLGLFSAKGLFWAIGSLCIWLFLQLYKQIREGMEKEIKGLKEGLFLANNRINDLEGRFNKRLEK